MLNKSALKTDKKLITKWSVKNVIKKKPDRAISTFLPTEEFENPLLIILFVCFLINRCTNVKIVWEVTRFTFAFFDGEYI